MAAHLDQESLGVQLSQGGEYFSASGHVVRQKCIILFALLFLSALFLLVMKSRVRNPSRLSAFFTSILAGLDGGDLTGS